MASQLTRFYLEDVDAYPVLSLDGKIFEDIDTELADFYEKKLLEREIEYIRVDL